MCAYMAILFQHISCTHSVPNSFSLEREAKLHYISTQRAAAAAMKFTAPLPQHTCYPPSLFWSVFTCLCIVIFSRQASLARQAFLITPLHGARLKTGKNAYAKK